MNKRQVTKFAGGPVTLLGDEKKVGDKAPNFTCLDTGLNEVSLSDFDGKKKLISVVPSLDTGVCALQTVRFNQEAAKLDDTVVLTISADLPFAQDRFGLDKEIKNAKLLSDHKDLDFGTKYGFVIEELRLLNRGVILIDANNEIKYIEYVEENTDHPNYEKAIEIAKSL